MSYQHLISRTGNTLIISAITVLFAIMLLVGPSVTQSTAIADGATPTPTAITTFGWDDPVGG